MAAVSVKMSIQSQLDFRLQLKLLISRIKVNNKNNNKSITQMVQVEFLTFQNQVMNKLVHTQQKITNACSYYLGVSRRF